MVRARVIEVDLGKIDADHERHASYARRAAGRHRLRRLRRLKILEDQRDGIGASLKEYNKIDVGDVPNIGVREGFIRLDSPRPSRGVGELGEDDVPPPTGHARDRDLGSRPPLTRLVYRGGGALRLYLTALYVGQLELEPRERFRNTHRLSSRRPTGEASWATLAGMAGSGAPRARRARVIRALDELAKTELVALGVGAEKYEEFTLLTETGDTTNYTRPGEGAGETVGLPAAFFLSGWHLVLTPAEVTMLLVVRAYRRHVYRDVGGIGVSIAESDRDTRYGVSGEVYQAIHTLDEFGLLRVNDSMPHRRRGRVRPKPADSDPDASAKLEPYHLLAIDAFDRPALTVVRHALRVNPIPPRLNQPEKDAARLDDEDAP